CCSVVVSSLQPSPRSTPCPYTTLFRSTLFTRGVSSAVTRNYRCSVRAGTDRMPAGHGCWPARSVVVGIVHLGTLPVLDRRGVVDDGEHLTTRVGQHRGAAERGVVGFDEYRAAEHDRLPRGGVGSPRRVRGEVHQPVRGRGVEVVRSHDVPVEHGRPI